MRALCARTSKPFEYAFLLDALKDERAQGITIDAARVFFKTARRHYIIIDAPGHIEFLQEHDHRRRARRGRAAGHRRPRGGAGELAASRYMLSMLGVRQIAVLVNKMDLVGYGRATFERIVAEYRARS